VNWPHRVVVTGVGIVSPVGLDAATYWASLKEGKSGIGQPATVPVELLQKEVVAEIKDFDPHKYFDDRGIAPLDRVSQFAIVAAKEAVAASGLSFDDGLADRTAVIVGTGVGGAGTIDESYRRLYRENATRIYPLTIPKLMPNAPASQVSMHIGLRGPSFGVVSACSSATHAIGLAFHMVRAGIAEAAVTGGAEACINLGTLKAWEDPVFCRERLGLDAPLGAIDRDRLNVHGGSLGAGHPFGATGGRIVATLAKALSETDPARRGRGLISICAAGGLGVTAIMEVGTDD